MEKEILPETWQDTRSSFRTFPVIRGLQQWVVLAVLLSVCLHILVYVAIIELPLGDYLTSESFRRAWDSKERERIQISPDLLSEVEHLAAIENLAPEPMVQAPDLTQIDAELDLFEAQENMPDKEVKLTPDVTDVTNFLKGEDDSMTAARPASTALISALEVTSSSGDSLLKEDISELSRAMLKSSAVSEDQLLLDVAMLDEGTAPPDDDLFDDLSRAEQSASIGAAEVEGFNTLDGLLDRAGKLPGNLKPVLMPTDLLFAYNEDTLADSARLSLMKLGLLIQKNPDSEFIIEGHTDSFGTDAFNINLSLRRAAAVANWLTQSLRLPSAGIQIKGYGESYPLVDPSGTPEQQQLNRRVEIVIRPKQS